MLLIYKFRQYYVYIGEYIIYCLFIVIYYRLK